MYKSFWDLLRNFTEKKNHICLMVSIKQNGKPILLTSFSEALSKNLKVLKEYKISTKLFIQTIVYDQIIGYTQKNGVKVEQIIINKTVRQQNNAQF